MVVPLATGPSWFWKRAFEPSLKNHIIALMAKAWKFCWQLFAIKIFSDIKW